MASVKATAQDRIELAARRVAEAAPALNAGQVARLRELLMAPTEKTAMTTENLREAA